MRKIANVYKDRKEALGFSATLGQDRFGKEFK